MKYCFNYMQKKHMQHLKDFDEITIEFKPSDDSLIEFMQQQNKRINIYISDEEDFISHDRIKLFDAIKKNYPDINFAFKLKDYKKDLTKEVLKIITAEDRDYKYFFRTIVTDFDTFWGYLNLKVSDIYIGEILGFNIKQCAEAAHGRNIRVRVFPNVAQSAWNETTGIMKFFIRPEDVEVYEPYVDVMEFFGDNDKNPTYLKIYKDGKWFGNLNEIIISLNEDIDSRCLLPSFAERRIECGKRCLKGGRCQVCAAMKGLEQTLTKKELTIKKLSRKGQARLNSNS